MFHVSCVVFIKWEAQDIIDRIKNYLVLLCTTALPCMKMKLFTLELCYKQKGSTWYQKVDFIPRERNGKVF